MRAFDILGGKKGVSILMVMVVMLILFIIGTSIIIAATSAINAELRQQEAMACSIYAKNIAAKLTKEIEGEVRYGSLWFTLPQEAYDLNMGGGKGSIELSGVTTGIFPDPDDGRGIDADGDVKNEFVRLDTDVKIQKHQKPYKSLYPVEEEVAGKPEEADIKIEMTIKITVAYLGSKYELYARYYFDGKAVGSNVYEGGDCKLQSGRWWLDAYYRN